MKTIALSVFFLLLASCSPKPEIVDTGLPGEIRVVVFRDENRNRLQDTGETGFSELIGLAQDISCPAQNFRIEDAVETSASGEYVFKDLAPGVYCVMYGGKLSPTTKLTVEVHLSSEQQAVVAFGVPPE